MKTILMATAAAAMLGLAACGQGPNEEAGEAVDEATDGAPAGSSTSDPAALPER